MPSHEHLTALIPAYNEAARIRGVVAATLRHLPVLVIDDGSTDQTEAEANAAGARVLRQTPNRGKGAALVLGFRAALAEGCHAVVTLDADGQHAPDDIPLFLTRRERGAADLIIGEREFGRMPPVRRLANTLGRAAFSWALGRQVRDNQSGYRLIGRPLMQAMLDSEEIGFELEVEMIVRAVELGLGIDAVPIRTIYAGEKSHIRPLAHTRRFARLVWETRRRRSRRRPR